jgi:hypothetical protein
MDCREKETVFILGEGRNSLFTVNAMDASTEKTVGFIE